MCWIMCEKYLKFFKIKYLLMFLQPIWKENGHLIEKNPRKIAFFILESEIRMQIFRWLKQDFITFFIKL